MELPELPFRLWPETGDPEEIEYLVAWQPPDDVFTRFPNLSVVFSVGAGVDQFDLKSFPPGVRLVRMLDPGITQGMVEYATMAVLALHRDLPAYLAAQGERVWRGIPWVPAQRRNVGIMGMGNLGQAIAQQLTSLGFSVSGWGRTPRDLPAIRSYAGTEEFDAFLQTADILLCVLPLTEQTQDILNASTFTRLPRGASLVNIGRGGHLVEADLLAALDSGQLSAAVIDVLNKEPPPPEHPFWGHPGVILTPHIAATTQADSGCEVLLDNIRRHLGGEPMLGEVDLNTGY